jgi:hypothetical protein
VERPAGRLRRRPRLQSAQPHVLRPLMNSLDHRPNKPIWLYVITCADNN